MSRIILNFFGEKISINKPKNMTNLRNLISSNFFFDEKDSEEIILTYEKSGQKKIIKNEEDLKAFLDSKINIINLNINQDSQIYKKNLNKILDEMNKKNDKLKSKPIDRNNEIYISLESANNSSWELSNEKEATGPYSEWRNNAIINPTKGQLLPAGFVNIIFKSLSGASRYDLYLDYKLIKSFEADTNRNNYEFEIRNNEVMKHMICVVATLSDGTEVLSNIRNFFISKKGIGIWQSQIERINEMNLSWYYNWSPNPLSNTNNVEFVPMIWGNFSNDSYILNWIKDKKWENYRYLLMFNEPDFNDQANMTPEQAVECWKYIEPIVDNEKVEVSSPVVAIPTVFYEDDKNDYGTIGGWLGKYNKLMAKMEYHDEFTAVHFYFDYPGEWVLDIFKRIHEFTGKPLWITEWGVGQWNQVQSFDWTGGPDEGNWQRELITKFIKEILPILDKTDYIERYAWFPFDGSNTEKFGNGAGGLFFNSENDPLFGQLTAAGKAYRDMGNPSGFNKDLITEDQVVLKKGDSGESSNDKRINVLEGKTIIASSELGGNIANNAIDNDTNTRWESKHGSSDPEWLIINLEDTFIVDGFKIIWEAAAAKEYKIQVSMDGKEWKDVYEVKDGKNGETKEDNFPSTSAKYIKLLGISKTLEVYGFSVYDFKVMGVKENKKLLKSKKIPKILHFGIKCDGCGISPITGCRYKCGVCDNFNYCEKCEKKFWESHNHPFLKIYNPKMAPIYFKCSLKDK